jgi:hypothetical protein
MKKKKGTRKQNNKHSVEYNTVNKHIGNLRIKFVSQPWWSTPEIPALQ